MLDGASSVELADLENRRSGDFFDSSILLNRFEVEASEGTQEDPPSATAIASGSRLFLQRDPNGYEDSVNLYAGMRWDPVNLRDPTGRLAGEGVCEGLDAETCRQVRMELAAHVDRAVSDAVEGSDIITRGIHRAGVACGDFVHDKTGNEFLSVTCASSTHFVGGTLALGPGLVKLPGAVAAVPSELGEGAAQTLEGVSERNSYKAWTGFGRVAGATGLVAGLVATVAGTLRGSSAPSRTGGELSIVDEGATGGGGGRGGVSLADDSPLFSGEQLELPFPASIRPQAPAGGGSTLYHYTTAAGRAGIIESGAIWASRGAKNARYGTGQYFTDIAPEAVGGRTLATTPAGRLSLGQLSSRLFRVPWNTRKLSHFIEVDVTGLGARLVAPDIWLIEGDTALTVTGRVVRSGPTLP
jgi:hypothetical protein